MPIYEKIPAERTVVVFDGANYEQVQQEVCKYPQYFRPAPEEKYQDPSITAEVFDSIHGSWIGVRAGQAIVRGTEDEVYPVDADVFAKTYRYVRQA